MLLTENQTDTICVAKPTPALEKYYAGFHQTIADFERLAKPYCSFKKMTAYDIWMRNFCPLQTDDNQYIGFTYQPDYLTHADSPLTTQKNIFTKFSTVNKIKIKMDGGHFVYNQKGDVLISEKVLSLNELSQNKITVILKSIGFKNVVWLSYDKNEITGHLDGTMQFLTNDMLIINDDLNKGKTSRLLYEQYCDIIAQKCSKTKLVPIPAVYSNQIKGFIRQAGYTLILCKLKMLFLYRFTD